VISTIPAHHFLPRLSEFLHTVLLVLQPTLTFR
jgi:hypothetical protein